MLYIICLPSAICNANSTEIFTIKKHSKPLLAFGVIHLPYQGGQLQRKSKLFFLTALVACCHYKSENKAAILYIENNSNRVIPLLLHTEWSLNIHRAFLYIAFSIQISTHFSREIYCDKLYESILIYF